MPEVMPAARSQPSRTPRLIDLHVEPPCWVAGGARRPAGSTERNWWHLRERGAVGLPAHRGEQRAEAAWACPCHARMDDMGGELGTVTTADGRSLEILTCG